MTDLQRTDASLAANTSHPVKRKHHETDINPANRPPSIGNEAVKRLRAAANRGLSWCTLHRFEDSERYFVDRPEWDFGQEINGKKRTSNDVVFLTDPDSFFSGDKDIPFMVYKTYFSDWDEDLKHTPDQRGDPIVIPEPDEESIKLTSKEMIETVQILLRTSEDLVNPPPDFALSEEISAPSMFWYHYRHAFYSYQTVMEPRHRQVRELLKRYMKKFEKDHEKVDAQMRKGLISCANITFFVRPGDVLLSHREGRVEGHLATTWPLPSSHDHLEASYNNFVEKQVLLERVWSVKTWSYGYNGQLMKKFEDVEITLDSTDLENEIEITQLNIIPLRFAGSELHKRLKHRGTVFWKYRGKRLVQHLGGDSGSVNIDGDRFMIDYSEYQRRYEAEQGRAMSSQLRKCPGGKSPVKMITTQDKPLAEPGLLLFPSTIFAYSLRHNKWVDLCVDHLHDVYRDNKPFQRLLIRQDAKELIKANSMIRGRGGGGGGGDLTKTTTMMLADKRNGFAILLHGGPGTGKSYTAKSIAEWMGKPLLRVTCGNIGSTTTNAEQHIESVLQLSKAWGGVVLWDTADVFLQEGPFTTLSYRQSNALATYLLRLNERYNGILIIISQSDESFSEGVKSRVHLSLHYPPLSRSQRFKIWTNILESQKAVGEQSIKFDKIEKYLDELADYRLNGHQIHNVFANAFHFAKFEQETMTYRHLEHIINVTHKNLRQYDE